MSPLEQIRRWTQAGWFRPLDLALTEFLFSHPPSQRRDDRVLYVAALASVQLGRGHVCVDLSLMQGAVTRILGDEPEFRIRDTRQASASENPPEVDSPLSTLSSLTADDWLAILASDDRCRINGGYGGDDAPLVAEGLRVYLRRYWHIEMTIQAGLMARASLPQSWCEVPAAVTAMPDILNALFPGSSTAGAIDWQQFACALVARQRFGIITGGPGTGKTTTVVRLLAALQALQALHQSQALRIKLAAPTGKAAARLNESIAGALNRLPLDQLLSAIGRHVKSSGQSSLTAEEFVHRIPTRVTTLHRLLGSRPQTRKFRHDRVNRLAADVVVVDEASMVDESMMYALLEALPPTSVLILLGDKDQLASVDAGAVLGELCQRAERGFYLPETADTLKALGAPLMDASLVDSRGQVLDQCIAMLRHSHRFSEHSGIGQLALAVNQGDLAAVEAVWSQSAFVDLARFPVHGLQEQGVVSDRLTSWLIEGGSKTATAFKGDGHAHFLQVMHTERPTGRDTSAWDRWALNVLTAFAGFQVLCATREGQLGVQGINRRVAEALRDRRLIARSDGWYPGRPVLVTRNDYSLGLMNGDIGIALALPAPEGSLDGTVLRVAFPAAEGGAGVRWILPSRLQDVETVYAMTVHKSQGSEFGHACLVLPAQLNPVVTRELIYTGITRARSWFSLVEGSREVFQEAIRKRVVRASGLGRGLGIADLPESS